MDKKKAETKNNLIKVLLAAAVLIILVIATIKITPYIAALSDPLQRAAFQEWINSLGIGGWFVILGIQILQIIIAFIPGEPVEIIAGLLYGTVGGLITCQIGILTGSFIVFFAVRKWGYPFVTIFISEDKLKSYKFLQNTSRLEMITFILFFIPGTPKDVLTYFAGLTPIHPLRFLSIAIFARIPSVVTSTLAGASIGNGNWGITILVFAITGILGIGGILFHKKFMNKMNTEVPDPNQNN